MADCETAELAGACCGGTVYMVPGLADSTCVFVSMLMSVALAVAVPRAVCAPHHVNWVWLA
jgi:hypothetical protein